MQDMVSLNIQSAKLAEKNEFFKGKSVFVTYFTDFSVDELQIMRQCIAQADEFSISFMIDKDCVEFTNNPFTEVVKTKKLITDICENSYIEFEEIFAENDCFSNDELRYISKNIFKSGSKIYDKKCENIKVVETDNLNQETEYICSEILRLCRENNYDFSDFAVTVNDMESCSSVLEEIFERYNIPFNLVVKKRVEDSPFIHYLNTLFKCLITEEYNSENLLNLIKSPFSPVFDFEANELEEYCIKWNVDGNMWLNDFTANDDKGEKYLEKINNCRSKIVEPLENFRKIFNNEKVTVGEICVAFNNMVREINLEKSVQSTVIRASLSENITYNEMGEDLKQQWNCVFSAVKTIYDLLGKENITLNDFIELLRLMISSLKHTDRNGKINCVKICDTKHSIISDVKINFVLEAIDGNFPAKSISNGLFPGMKRKFLKKKQTYILLKTKKEIV